MRIQRLKRANNVDLDYKLPHQDLCCLQIQLFSFLVPKELNRILHPKNYALHIQLVTHCPVFQTPILICLFVLDFNCFFRQYFSLYNELSPTERYRDRKENIFSLFH